MKSNNSTCDTPIDQTSVMTKSASTTSKRRATLLSGVYALVLVLTAAGAARSAAAAGDYTEAQAAAGHQVFAQHCAKCHGSNLQGQSGPPLAGPKFESNLGFSKMSAKQLFTFIKTQMPYDAPGSLNKKQYLQALSYVLSKNGYPQGSTPLSESRLGEIRLLPYPGVSNSKQKRQANSQSN